MALRRGIPLLIQQFRALFTKNLILSWRSKRSTFLQLFSSLFFLFLIFCIQKAMESRFASTTSFENVFDPKAVVSPPIPPCEDKFYVKLPCFDFVWSGSDNPRIGSIVDRIRENNPGRPIPSNKVTFVALNFLFFAVLVSFFFNYFVSTVVELQFVICCQRVYNHVYDRFLRTR